jgi:hypothetical protein
LIDASATWDQRVTQLLIDHGLAILFVLVAIDPEAFPTRTRRRS